MKIEHVGSVCIRGNNVVAVRTQARDSTSGPEIQGQL